MWAIEVASVLLFLIVATTVVVACFVVYGRRLKQEALHRAEEHVRQKLAAARVLLALPPKIYKCSYCDYYVESGDPLNPTSTIYNHVESVCKRVDRSKGPPTVRFWVISNVEEMSISHLMWVTNWRAAGTCATEAA
jgi:hypothetical protein